MAYQQRPQWTTCYSPEGYPYYTDGVRSLWASPNDWVEGYDSMSGSPFWRNSITGEVVWDESQLTHPSVVPQSARGVAHSHAHHARSHSATANYGGPDAWDSASMYAEEYTSYSPLHAEASSLQSRGYAAQGRHRAAGYRAHQPSTFSNGSGRRRSVTEPQPVPMAFGVQPRSSQKKDRRERAERAILAARRGTAQWASPSGPSGPGHAGPGSAVLDRIGRPLEETKVGRHEVQSDDSADGGRGVRKKLYEVEHEVEHHGRDGGRYGRDRTSEDEDEEEEDDDTTLAGRDSKPRYGDDGDWRAAVGLPTTSSRVPARGPGPSSDDMSSDDLEDLVKSGFSLAPRTTAARKAKRKGHNDRGGLAVDSLAVSAKAPVGVLGSMGRAHRDKAGPGAAMAFASVSLAQELKESKRDNFRHASDRDMRDERDIESDAELAYARAAAAEYSNLAPQEREAWLQSVLPAGLSGLGLASQAQSLVSYLASRSVPFLTTVFAAARLQTEGAIRYLEGVTAAAIAHATSSGVGLPVTVGAAGRLPDSTELDPTAGPPTGMHGGGQAGQSATGTLTLPSDDLDEAGYATALSAGATPTHPLPIALLRDEAVAGAASLLLDVQGRLGATVHAIGDTLGAGLQHVQHALGSQGGAAAGERAAAPFQAPPPDRDALPEHNGPVHAPVAIPDAPTPTLTDILFSPTAISKMMRACEDPRGTEFPIFATGLDKDEIAALKGRGKDGGPAYGVGSPSWTGSPSYDAIPSGAAARDRSLPYTPGLDHQHGNSPGTAHGMGRGQGQGAYLEHLPDGCYIGPSQDEGTGNASMAQHEVYEDGQWRQQQEDGLGHAGVVGGHGYDGQADRRTATGQLQLSSTDHVAAIGPASSLGFQLQSHSFAWAEPAHVGSTAGLVQDRPVVQYAWGGPEPGEEEEEDGADIQQGTGYNSYGHAPYSYGGGTSRVSVPDDEDDEDEDDYEDADGPNHGGQGDAPAGAMYPAVAGDGSNALVPAVPRPPSTRRIRFADEVETSPVHEDGAQQPHAEHMASEQPDADGQTGMCDTTDTTEARDHTGSLDASTPAHTAVNELQAEAHDGAGQPMVSSPVLHGTEEDQAENQDSPAV